MTTIYLDMDDVIADFKSYAISVLRKPQEGEKWLHEEWVKLKDNPRLYRDLDLTGGAEALVSCCRYLRDHHGFDLLFLTAVPKNNDVHWAFYDKVNWAQLHFPDIPVMFGPYSHDKHVHCDADMQDILIDDRLSNCQEWTNAGGIAIQHKGDFVKTISALMSATEHFK